MHNPPTLTAYASGALGRGSTPHTFKRAHGERSAQQPYSTPFPPQRSHPMPEHTPRTERAERLARRYHRAEFIQAVWDLVAAGNSYGETGAKLAVSRNVVAGILWRKKQAERAKFVAISNGPTLGQQVAKLMEKKDGHSGI